ncbi:MAG: hypothetical protein ABSB78_14120 [Bacteroidota bacterium]
MENNLKIDKKDAKEFDLNLPEWRVSGNAVLGLAAIAAALYACGPGTPLRPTDAIASPTTIATETYTSTATQTQILETPTVTLTPSETKVSVPKYYKGVAPDLASFTLVMPEQEKLIMADIMAHLQLTGKPQDTIVIQPYDNPDFSGVNLRCHYGENCVVRASISRKDPYGGPDIRILVFEFLNPDGTHGYLRGYLGSDDNQYVEHDARRDLNSLLGFIEEDKTFTLGIMTYIKPKHILEVTNKIVLDFTTNSPDQDKLSELDKSTDSIPADLSDTTVWIYVIDF